MYIYQKIYEYICNSNVLISVFQHPVTDYHLPIKQLICWFEEIVVTRKREEISALLKKLMTNYNTDLQSLPDITFPTLNG